MKKTKFSENQIIAILKAVEAGREVEGISNWIKQNPYEWNYE